MTLDVPAEIADTLSTRAPLAIFKYSEIVARGVAAGRSESDIESDVMAAGGSVVFARWYREAVRAHGDGIQIQIPQRLEDCEALAQWKARRQRKLSMEYGAPALSVVAWACAHRFLMTATLDDFAQIAFDFGVILLLAFGFGLSAKSRGYSVVWGFVFPFVFLLSDKNRLPPSP